ncbi:hypothetical protein RFI_20289, partial [Reticulomyxa filosa]
MFQVNFAFEGVDLKMTLAQARNIRAVAKSGPFNLNFVYIPEYLGTQTNKWIVALKFSKNSTLQVWDDSKEDFEQPTDQWNVQSESESEKNEDDAVEPLSEWEQDNENQNEQDNENQNEDSDEKEETLGHETEAEIGPGIGAVRFEHDTQRLGTD